MADKKSVLITGGKLAQKATDTNMISDSISSANSGIGFELANQLLAKGDYHVLLGSRSVDKGQAAVKDLQSRNLPGSVELIQVDVTKDDTIEAAVKQVESKHGKLDILVNNAGTGVLGEANLRKQLEDSFEANAIGPAVLTQALAPMLKKSTASSPGPRIVNVTSGAGSVTSRLDPNAPGADQGLMEYRSSKAALNMIAACQLFEYKNDGIKVFLYCPGHTVSNLGPYNKAEYGAKAVDVAVKPLVDIVEGQER